MHRVNYAVFLLLVFCVPLLAGSPSGANCRRYLSKHLQKEVEFCVERTVPSSSAKEELTVYFFHGMGGNARSYVNNGYSRALSELSATASLPPATLISFETNPASFFSDVAGDTTSYQAYETWLISEFMPYVENEFPWTCRSRKCRGTLGLSMGGYGALKTALRHPDKFAFTAANCPALSPFSLYAPESDWRAYFARHEIGVHNGMMLLAHVKGIFTTPALADANDPSFLAQSLSPAHAPRLYFDVGGKDYFGFQEGHFRLKSELDKRAIPYESHFDPNEGHEIFVRTNRKALEFLFRTFEN